MSDKIRKPTYIQTRKTQRRLQNLISGLVLGGSIVAATAIVISAPRDPSEDPLPAVAQSRPETKTPGWAQDFSKEPAVIEAHIETSEPSIDLALPVHAATRPEAPELSLAIAHEDETTDFEDRAKRHIDKGELSEALTDMRMHIHASEASQDELFLIGTLARQTQQMELAEAALLQAAALPPERSEIHTELARLYLNIKDSKAARDAARDAIDLDKDNPAAWNVFARSAMQASQWEQAELAMRQALELDPTNPLYHNNAGLLYIYMRRAGDAVDALETSVELYEDDAPYFVFNNLGLAHEMAANLDEAREAFEEALLMNPFYSKAKVNLSRIEASMAKAEEAAAFQTAQGVKLPADAPSDGT